MTTRDRDAAGRPESSRPRDGLGRPLPRGAEGVEPVDTRARTASEALDAAQSYLDREMPFHAHEVLEDRWKATGGDERGLWQGLAQLAVGLTHQRRGNLPGALSVTSRGADALATYESARPYGIDIAGLVAWARGLAADPAGDVAVPRLRG